MAVELSRRFRFEAAHRLPTLPPEHKCFRLHGHSFEVEVAVGGEIDPDRGWFVDYKVISEAVKPLIEALDHRYLNEIEGLENPTSENVAAWLWRGLEARLPGLAWIAVSETPRSRCVYRGGTVASVGGCCDDE
jgi:6-pyruvoyltetrahydropterin/6-carboxytetrahydropterin synthase